MKCVIDRMFKRGIEYRIKDLADFVGISRVAIYNILDSKSIPNVYIAIKICQFFNKIDPMDYTPEDFWKEGGD